MGFWTLFLNLRLLRRGCFVVTYCVHPQEDLAKIGYYIYIYMKIENLMNPSIFWLSMRTYLFVEIWWFYIICLFWKYGEFGPWFFFPKIKIQIREKNPLNGSKSILFLFYFILFSCESGEIPKETLLPIWVCLFGHFLLNLRFLKTQFLMKPCHIL